MINTKNTLYTNYHILVKINLNIKGILIIISTYYKTIIFTLKLYTIVFVELEIFKNH